MNEAAKNTDRELWRETEGDYYSPSIHVTESGGIGINVGGHVIVKPLREWHALASPPGDVEKGIPIKRTGVEPFDKSSLYLGKDGE